MKNTFYANGYYKGMQQERRFFDVAEILRKYAHGGKFLDVGCGDGDVTLFLSKAVNAEEVCGLEISEEAVRGAVRKGVNALVLDVGTQPFPFQDNYFDLAYCGEIIEHVFNPEHLLSEVRRVLKPAGICVLTTPNLAGWPNRIVLLFGYQPFPTSVSPMNEALGKLFVKGKEGQWGHIRVFTLKALKALIKLHNFEIVKFKGSTATLDSQKSIFMTLILLIDRLMSRITSLSTRIILVMRKR